MANRAHVSFYKAKDGWRWHLRAGNGRIIAESGEAYTERNKARAAYDRVRYIMLTGAEYNGDPVSGGSDE